MNDEKKKPNCYWLFWTVAAVCFLCGTVGIITICLLRAQKSQLPYSYGIGIDAGSSRTDFYVYRWPTGKKNGTGVVEQIYKCPNASEKKMPALASFASAPDNVGVQAIRPCMDRILSVVPPTDYSDTPVFLGATAGMRVLSAADERAAEAILTSVRSTLASYPFQFAQPQHQARIISGGEEGAFGWVTSNYLSGSFWGEPGQQPVAPPSATVGALDMGGASTQVAFAPSSPQMTDENSEFIYLFGYSYGVYSHSYLCYGFEEANRKYRAQLVQRGNFSRTIDDPCAPSGNISLFSFTYVFKEPCTSPDNLPEYAKSLANRSDYFVFRGTSDSGLCRNLTLGIFNTSAACSRPPCTFDGVHQPTVNGQFFAFSGYYLSVTDIGLDANRGFSLTDFRSAIDNYCNKTWAEATRMGKSEQILVILCFQNQHVYHLLVDIYGFNDSTWNNIQFVSKINGSDFGWILGMMLNATNDIPSHDYVTTVNDGVFIPLLLTFSALLLAAFLAVVLAFLWSRKAASPLNSTGNENQTFYGI